MTTNDQPHTIPAGLTSDEAQAVREWAERARGAEVQDKTVVHAARVLLAVLPKRPTLADMSPEERAACQWMQADTETRGRVVIVNPCPNGGRAGLLSRRGNAVYEGHTRITPRPDLPRMEWPGDTPTPTPATLTVGSVWGDIDSLTLACETSGRGQIVVADCEGDVSVWSEDEGWWTQGLPSCGYEPYTIIHAGREADQ